MSILSFSKACAFHGGIHRTIFPLWYILGICVFFLIINGFFDIHLHFWSHCRSALGVESWVIGYKYVWDFWYIRPNSFQKCCTNFHPCQPQRRACLICYQWQISLQVHRYAHMHTYIYIGPKLQARNVSVLSRQMPPRQLITGRKIGYEEEHANEFRVRERGGSSGLLEVGRVGPGPRRGSRLGFLMCSHLGSFSVKPSHHSLPI